MDAVKAFLAEYIGAFDARDGCRGWEYENLEVKALGGKSMLATMDLVAGEGGIRLLASTFHLS